MLSAPVPEELSLLVRRTAGLQPWRRAFHALSGLVVALVPGAFGWERPLVVALLAGALVLMVGLDLARLRSPAVNAWFFRSVPSLASPREASRMASSTWFATGGLLTWALFPAAVAAPAILVLALADPAASVFGRLLPSKRIGTGSIGGSAVFALVATGVVSSAVSWPAALAVGLGVAATEVIPWRLDDNLTIPLATAALLSLAGG